MNKKKVGIVFVSISALLALANLSFTGAAIGAGSTLGFGSLIAVVFFISGIFMMASNPNLEGILEAPDTSGVVSKEKIFKTFETNFPYASQGIIADTSFLISYITEKEAMVDYLNAHGEVIVPEEVIHEFKGRRQSDIINFLRENTKRPDEGYKQHMDHAREILNMGEKAYLYEIVDEILSGKEPVPEAGSEELKEYSLAIDKLKRSLAKNGIDASNKNLRTMAKKHWAVSEADTAVLAIAMNYESHGKRSLIMEKDKDFEEAVSYMKRVDHSKKVNFLNAYGRIA